MSSNQNDMGLIYAEIELINGGDLELARRKFIGEDEIKRMMVTALVDTGSYMLAINENFKRNCSFQLLKKEKRN